MPTSTRLASKTLLALAAVALTTSLACTSGTEDEAGDGGETAGDEAMDDSTDTTGDSTDTAGETETTGETETMGDTTDAGPTDTDASTDDTTETGEPDCEGPLDAVPPLEEPQPADPKAPGSSWAHFQLEDFQPQSCNFGETTSLEAYKGRVTLVTLMRTTCEICQGTIEKLEEMRLELELEGYDVYFLAINQMGYESTQQEFIDRVAFPLLQDTAEVDAWELLNDTGLGTDDIYIYGADGLLRSYFNYADNNPTIVLETEEGWNNVYNAMIAALTE